MWGGNTEPAALWHLAHHCCSRPGGGGGRQSSAQTDSAHPHLLGMVQGWKHAGEPAPAGTWLPSRKLGSLPVLLGSKGDCSDPRPSDTQQVQRLELWPGVTSPQLPQQLHPPGVQNAGKSFQWDWKERPEASDRSWNTAVHSHCPAELIKGAYSPLCTHIDLEVHSERCVLSTSDRLTGIRCQEMLGHLDASLLERL